MVIDKSFENILVIHYPSGGYGYYIARLVNYFLQGTVPVEDTWQFDHLGTSHLYRPTITAMKPLDLLQGYQPKISSHAYDLLKQGNWAVVPCCTGIDNDDISPVLEFFPNAQVLRVSYDEDSWPLIFYNTIVKAKQGNIDQDVEFDQTRFGSSDDWARRENYTTMMHSHPLRKNWKTQKEFCEVTVDRVINDPLELLTTAAHLTGLTIKSTDQIETLHQKFLQSNTQIKTYHQIKHAVNSLHDHLPLNDITELYWQAYCYYQIERIFGIQIPYNSHSQWFTNTKDIATMLDNLKDPES